MADATARVHEAASHLGGHGVSLAACHVAHLLGRGFRGHGPLVARFVPLVGRHEIANDPCAHSDGGAGFRRAFGLHSVTFVLVFPTASKMDPLAQMLGRHPVRALRSGPRGRRASLGGRRALQPLSPAVSGRSPGSLFPAVLRSPRSLPFRLSGKGGRSGPGINAFDRQGGDNELFVLLADLLELSDSLDPLLRRQGGPRAPSSRPGRLSVAARHSRPENPKTINGREPAIGNRPVYQGGIPGRRNNRSREFKCQTPGTDR